MSKQRVLVIDDELDIRGLIRLLLEGEGYAVSEAADGASALAAARQNPPDLILTDYMLPDLDGFAIIQRLEESGLSAPVILMTAKGSEEIAVRALRAGMRDYLIKPFDADELRRAVRQRLGDAKSQGQPPTGKPDALDDLRTFGKTAPLMIDLEQVLPRVLEAAVQVTRAEEGNLMLLDPATGELYTRVSKNLEGKLQTLRLRTESSLAGQVISTRRPLLINSESQQKIKTEYLVHSLLYVPLIAGQEVIGVLGLFNRTTDRTISEEDLDKVAALASDVAAAIHTVQQLEESRQQAIQFERLFQNVHDPIVAVDRTGHIVLCNPAARGSLLADKDMRVIGRAFKEVIPNSDLLELLDPNNAEFPEQAEIELGPGRFFNVQVSEAEGIGRVAVLQDITHLKELDRLKTDLVTHISHDLRSPLTAILSYVELMNRVGQLNEQQLAFSGQAKESVRLITEMVNNLLDIERLEPSADRHVEELDLKSMVEQSLRAVAGKAELKNQRVTFEAPERVAPVSGVPMRLRQVFGNLIDNAIKYTPDGGELRIRIFEQGEQVVVSVSDTGIGIPPDEQARIFDKGFRASGVTETHEGRGIGLSIVKSVVEAHNGRVWLQSAPGQGTTFTVMLPAAKSHIG